MNSTNKHKDISDSFLQVRKLENVAMLARATACVSLWQLMAKELDMKRIQFLPPTTVKLKDMYNVFTHAIRLVESDIATWNQFHDTTIPVADVCGQMESDIVGFTQRLERSMDSTECVLCVLCVLELTRFMNDCMKSQEFNAAVVQATFDNTGVHSHLLDE